MPHHHHAGHQHHHMEKRQDAGTVVQYVYETAAKTFEGPVGGYMTVNPPAAEPTPDSSFSNSNANANSNSISDANSNSNSNSNSDSNSDSSLNSQGEDQQDAQMLAAAAAASSSVVAEEIAKASSSAIAAAKASMELAAAPKQTQQVETPTQAAVQVATSAETTTAAVKATPTVATSKSTLTPVVTPATSASPTIATTPTSSFIEASQAATSSQPTDNATLSGKSSGGMSGGAKAGLAIGILLIIGLLAGGIFFCYRRKKKQENDAYSKADDEKSAYPGGLARAQSTVSTRTTATAPRLSLRPVTQFLPDLAARGKAANAAGAGAAGASRDHNDPSNPFGNHAEVARLSEPSFENEKTTLQIQANAPSDPFSDTAGTAASNTDRSKAPTADIPAPLRVRTPTPEASVAAGAIAAGASAVAGAKIAERSNAPKPLNMPSNRSVSPVGASPTVSEFSQTPASPGAMANGPPPSNVHRIQLDFKPSMEDELSLRAGQLVRLLHEYDDGWALCIRLDRSQQGVAPRTCLSARPVKPRPPPGARGPGGPGPRGPPPGMMGPGPQRPSSPASGRGSPGPPRNRAPRPTGPGQNGSQQRSMSPGPYGGGPHRPAIGPPPAGKPRSNSASDLRERRNSPPGPSPMNPNTQRVPMQLQAVTSPDQALSQSPPQTMARKPVPGQAM